MRKNNQKRRAVKKDAEVTGSLIEEKKHPVIVVGVGASVGSQKSLQKFFSEMPTGCGLAFVLVQHMEPARKNKIVRSLKDQTALNVVEATDGTPVLTDSIHVIPPDKFLNITAGILTLKEPVLCNGLRMPIDHFFCSLAVDQRRRSIGILLSGRGGDGTMGLSEIRAAGGRTLVEDPGSAKHPDMSQSAIKAGVVDSVLPASGMAEAVMKLAEQVIAETSSLAGSPDIDADLRAVLDILRAKVGHDFRCYKPSTLVRRIRRRMSLAKIASLEDYAQFLREHPEEVGLLQKDLFIGVTDFFRQPHAWETLAEKVIAPLVDNTQSESEIRVWVPGCSTGKEAYSLAMLLIEQVEKSGKKVNVQIFATDSDLAALATARSGIYSKEDFGENISPQRLKRFFARKDGHYQVVKDIREMVVFAPQNITADPPFSRLDLISCRNLLIYLDQQVQKKIIDLFHFSLREGGILFLGTAETVGDREELFELVSKKWRIYRRIGIGHRVGIEIPVRLTAEPGRVAAKLPLATPPSRVSLASGAQHMLLDRFAPACVMIDRRLQVLYVHGAVEDYLSFPAGELTTRVIDMAREGLRARLRGAITKCLHSNKSVSVTARVRRSDKSVPVKTVVSPLRYPRDIDGLLLITFEDYLIPVAKTRGKPTKESDTQHLMDELKITREELQSTIEQLEHSNDELKASNEEVTAANEELQSANEELETSKEELQSLNEELNTINIRLQEKVDELEGVNNDVVNLLSSTNIATVFLDKNLRVKRYTPAITRLLSLIPSDAGRHIGDVLRKFSDDALLDDSRRVLASLTPLSTEVQADDGRWYIRSITPYRTQDDRIEGVVITLVDVADLKKAEEALYQLNRELEERVAEQTGELRTASLYSRSLIEASLDPLVTISPEGRITDVNEATEHITGRTRRELIGTDFSDYFTEPDAAQMGYRKVFADGQVRDYPLTIHHASGSTTDVLYNATIYHNEAGEVQGVFAAARDITEIKRAEAALRELNEALEQRVAERTAELEESRHRLAVIVDSIADGFYALDRDWRFTHVNDEALRHIGKMRQEIIDHKLFEVFPSVRGSVTETQYRHAMESGEPAHFESPSAISDMILEIHAYPGPETLTVLFRDITERHRLTTALQEAHEHAEWLARFPEENPNPVMRVSNDAKILYCNPACMEILGWESEVGRQMPDPLRPVLEQAVSAGRIADRDVELGDRAYLVSAIPFPEEGYANIYGRDITERKRAEEGLREREQLLQDVIDGSTSPIFLKDRDGKFITINATLEKMLGMSREDIKGKTDYDIAPREVADCWHEHDKKVMTAGKAMQIEEVADLLDGHHIFLANKFPLVDAHGQIYGVGAISHDIAERKQAEEALSRSQKTFLELVERAPFGIYIVDSGFCIAHMNIGSQNGAFRNVRPVIGRDFNEAMHILWPDDVAEEIIAHFRHTLDTGEPYYSPQFINPRHDEKIVESYEWELHRMTLPDGQYGVICYYFDSTALREAEEALRESEAKYRNLFENMTEEVHFWKLVRDENGQIKTWRLVDVNPPTLKTWGRKSREDTIGRTADEIYPGATAHYMPVVQKIMTEGVPYSYEDYFPAPVDKYFRFTSVPLGEYFITTGADITSVKKAELALRESEALLRRQSEMLEHAPVLVRNLKDEIILWNSGMENLYGYSRGEAMGRVYHDLLQTRHPQPLAENVCRIGHERSWEGELHHKRKDGKEIIVTSLQVLHSDADGNAAAIIEVNTDITERKQAEEDLQIALQRLHALIANMHSSILLVGEGRIEMANRAFCDYFGLQDSPGDLVGLTPRQLIDKIKNAYLHPDEQVRRIWEIARGGQPVIGEEISMRDGRTSLRDFVPIHVDGKSYGLLWHHIDITERKEMEEELRQSEVRFRLLSTTAERLLRAEDPQSIIDNLCRDVMAQLDCQAFFNFLVDENAGRLRLNVCAGITEEDARAIEWLDYGVAVCGCVARDRTRIISEDIFHTPDVRTDLIKSFGIQAYCCHPLMSQDRLIGTLSFGTKTRPHFTGKEVELMRTVSDQVAVAMQRKQTEQMVLHVKQEWERTFDAVPDLIAILDDRHRILRANRAMAERLGVAPEECVGEACHKAVHGLGYPPDFCPHTLALADGREHVEEVHEDCLGGDFLVSATPLTDELGRLVGSVHVARDITKRKQAEQILQERTAELEIANKELESFSYSVSHDLRAPLRAIDGYARMIFKKQGDKFDEDTRRKFNDIRLNAKMMGQLIDDLLAFSRLGKKHMSISKLDMGDVMRDVWKEMQTANPERDMKLTVDEMPSGYGDRMLIKQVYSNLLSNAVKFSKLQDVARIEVGGYTEGDEHVYYVRDNGVGFDMAYYDKLFGVFQRLHKPDDFEGTGVGLATVQRIIHRHGGRVWAEGKVGEGATFYFSLPVKK